MLSEVIKYFNPKTILDIGANIGQFYLESIKVVPDAKYFLIEANEKCQTHLKNLGVEYHIGVFSNEEKESTFFLTKRDELCTGNSLYRENTSFFSDEVLIEKKVITKTLDSFFNNRELNQFDLIKIDTQGSELDIMKGGKKIIQNCLGLIIETSVSEYNQNAPNQSLVFEYMNSLGFEKKSLVGVNMNPDTGQLVHEDYLFINKKILS